MPHAKIEITPFGRLAYTGRLTLAQAYELKQIAEARIAEEPPVDTTPAPEYSEPTPAPEVPVGTSEEPTETPENEAPSVAGEEP